MDLQMVLVEKGYAEVYATPEQAALPAWANYKNTLYANSVEPVAILYNKSGLGSLTPPKTRAELIEFLRKNKDALQGKVAVVVNVASKCGYTPQYAGLEKLYRELTPKGVVSARSSPSGCA